MSILADIGNIFSALASRDSFEIRNALKADAAWYLGAITTLLGGFIVMHIYRAVPFIERHLERTIMVWSYLAIAAIIFWGVIDRFIFSNQQPWSTTIPPLLFMIMAWYGCTFNIRLRTHLSFSEFRNKLGRRGQLFWLTFDNVLWLVFCIIVVTTTARVTVNTYDNFAIVLGTDDIMRWWFLITMPMCFILLATRAIENILEDFAKYLGDGPMIEQAVIGGDT